MKTRIIFLLLLFFIIKGYAISPKQIPIKIENNKIGAPITIGIPFPKGELFSVDNIRLFGSNGKEIACQTTEVTTWQPADGSIKWIWVFFFSEKSSDYLLEYGNEIAPIKLKERIISSNNMRPRGGITVNTGPLSFSINKMGSGFLDEIHLDSDHDGKFSKNELISSAPNNKRGTFLDILDDAGIDMSNAKIHEVFREKGSGPLHVIFRVEGTYFYNQKDNNPSPFEIRIHAYAGKTYIKVLHTLIYTGVPDKHKIQEGEHYNIATQNEKICSEDTANDPGWTQPNDQISGCGLSLVYHLDKDQQVLTPIYDDEWSVKNSKERIVQFDASLIEKTTLLQTGPKQNNPTGVSTPTERIKGFEAKVYQNKTSIESVQKAKGWIDISDSSKGIAIGIKNFFQEYPKELQIDPKTGTVTGYIWPTDADPMSFERKNTKKDGGMLGNFAQGVAKTTEFIYYFHNKATGSEIDNIMDYSLKSPVAHTSAEWYTGSKVYGNMAPFSKKHPEYENALQYKYDWWIYNQNWEAWYGMFDHGDGKAYYFNGKWYMWNNNEPTIDFMFWTNFMRTGKAEYYYAAQNMSKHTMDVDNIHWPKKRKYIGENNDAIDYWNYEDEEASTPYLGIGRRHGREHWSALLSAHVWVQGWIASYYITGDGRALEVAKMTGDTYINRIWGDHDLRGRRLYLSILNLIEIYDATKLEKYKKELDDRIQVLLSLQKEQGGNLILDRYGYSQNYATKGLYKYWQLTNDNSVKKALVDHARWVKDLPPLNHEMESYLATIYSLILGYEFTGNRIYLDEALERAKVLKVDRLNDNFTNQKEYSEALLNISKLPTGEDGAHTIWKIDNGLRVFGWTHAYNIPYLLYYIDQAK
ncbi:exo-rhamnogalacturonan lyase family protein [Changchengzhania lutea]|uniref:exo-rhamnogalacturonan lyase family protein n=1 Tax=Changchengzhania lutea TaxID=2049305 RepID=UPI00115D18BA|nr:hypothetical protein [Changchengzhania lutea]